MCQQRISKMSRAPFIPYARVMIEAEESGALKSSAKAEFTAIEPTTRYIYARIRRWLWQRQP